ncbi:MAG: hypothetical protein AB1831_15400 [Pseudomonadota bacterium]
MSSKTYEELVWQLSRLPGGAAAALPDFFGSLLAAPPEVLGEDEVWQLHAGRLLLRGQRLSAETGGEETPIAELPAALLEEARKAGLSPLLLGLLAIATGDVDGDRRLKAVLSKVDGAAKDLMLMTVCRLCG